MALDFKTILPYDRDWLRAMLTEVIEARKFVDELIVSIAKAVKQSKARKETQITFDKEEFLEDVPSLDMYSNMEFYLRKKVKELCRSGISIDYIVEKQEELKKVLQELNQIESIFGDNFVSACGGEED